MEDRALAELGNLALASLEKSDLLNFIYKSIGREGLAKIGQSVFSMGMDKFKKRFTTEPIPAPVKPDTTPDSPTSPIPIKIKRPYHRHKKKDYQKRLPSRKNLTAAVLSILQSTKQTKDTKKITSELEKCSILNPEESTRNRNRVSFRR